MFSSTPGRIVAARAVYGPAMAILGEGRMRVSQRPERRSRRTIILSKSYYSGDRVAVGTSILLKHKRENNLPFRTQI